MRLILKESLNFGIVHYVVGGTTCMSTACAVIYQM